MKPKQCCIGHDTPFCPTCGTRIVSEPIEQLLKHVCAAARLRRSQFVKHPRVCPEKYAVRWESWEKALRELLAQAAGRISSPDLQTPLAVYPLSVRAGNSLRAAGIATIGQLAARQESDLRVLRNFGEASYREVVVLLSSLGLRLGMSEDECAEGGE